MEEQSDYPLEYLKSKVKEAEEHEGLDSINVMYALEKLLEALQERKRSLEAANVAARIKVLQNKLGLSAPEKNWKPLPALAEKKLLTVLAFCLLAMSIAWRVIGAPQIGPAWGVTFALEAGALSLLYRVYEPPRRLVLIAVGIWLAFVFGMAELRLEHQLAVDKGLDRDHSPEEALALCRLGKHEAAKRAFDKGIKASAADSEQRALLLRQRAECKFSMGDAAGALSDCDASLLISKHLDTFYDRAQINYALHNYADAEKDYADIITSCPREERLQATNKWNIIDNYFATARAEYSQAKANQLYLQYKTAFCS